MNSRTTQMIYRFLFALTICACSVAGGFAQDDGEKKIVVCSTTQIADFARNIVADDWKVICVLGAGEDPHTYETRSSDASAVAGANLCLQNGWNLEGHSWMTKLAENANKPIRSCITGVTALQLEEGGETVDDPHAWFSPANATIYVDNILAAVSEVDPENKSKFEARAVLYKIQLVALDNWIQRQLSQVPANKRVLVTHHNAFGYFCNRYQFQAFSPVGWSTEELTAIGINDRKNVVDQIRETGVKAIFVETTINKETIRGIARDAGVSIGGELYSDAMGAEGTAGETYLGMMRENVITIVESLK